MRSAFLREVLATSFVLMAAILPASARAQASDLVDLGVATGYAINNAGQVVLSTGIYSNGTTTPLPTLPGQTMPATGAAINATGQVAGSAPTSMPNPAGGNFDFTVPVEFSSGTLTILQSPSEYADNISSEAYATGINSSAEIVGYSVSPDIGPADIVQGYDDIAFIYANGTIGSLPSSGLLPITNMPQGINDSGLITGIRSVQDPNNPGINRLDAYIYDYGTGTTTDLGQGAGYAINASGEVTGELDVINVVDQNDHIIGMNAFLYSNGKTTNLGTLPGGTYSSGFAINSTGQVVGYSTTAVNANSHAFFYNGAMNDLNTLVSATDPLKPYATLTGAVGINDGLLILANGVDSRTNLSHAYLYQASFIELAPAALNFTQAVGGTSQLQSVTVTNAGTVAIPFETASINGDFSLRTDNCGTSLAPGAQCRIGVVFVPEVIGVLTGALNIPSAGANYQVPLSGVAPITATISASANTMTVGKDVTITWSASAGTSCIWQASTSPNNPSVPSTGSKVVTASTANSVTYSILCSFAGLPAAEAQVVVQWTWPAVTATISASPTTITAGQSTALTWKSSNATSCTATGGGEDDQWAGAKATSGSQTVTEAFGPAVSSALLTFGITCNSTTSGLSGSASAKVTEESSSAPSSHGGGGGLNPLSLVLLAGIFALRRIRHCIAVHN